jgi:hypothetical protein
MSFIQMKQCLSVAQFWFCRGAGEAAPFHLSLALSSFSVALQAY